MQMSSQLILIMRRSETTLTVEQGLMYYITCMKVHLSTALFTAINTLFSLTNREDKTVLRVFSLGWTINGDFNFYIFFFLLYCLL